jgi:mannose-6-phosphate isomerase-like protein (cupin superfamily)
MCVLATVPDALVAPTPADVERLEARLLNMEQVDCPLIHRFTDGAYLREILMPAGTFIIGQKHRTRHFNIVLSGKAVVMIDGVIEQIEAPKVFESEPGVRKVLYIVEDMRWATLHVTSERDLEKLEETLIEKSPAFLAHELEEAQKLKELIAADANA